MASISCRHVKKVYPGNVTAVPDFNLEIADKEFIVFVGPSGCGKSTTLRMIAGLEEISGGEMYIGDRLINDVPPKDRDIAMVFQNYALYPHMTVYKNMAFGLELRKMPKDEIDKRVREAAKILEIEHLLDRKPKALSGGQRQRVALGRAMVRNPAVFLLDEPLSNLDAKLREEMLTEIRLIQHDIGTTILYITHDQEAALQLCDRMAIMDREGKLCQIGEDEDIILRPANRFVFEFIGVSNFFPLVRENGHTYLVAGEKFLYDECPPEIFASGKPMEMGSRLNDMVFDDQSPIRGRITRSVFLGSEYVYFIQLGNREIRMQVNALDVMQNNKVEEGQEVGLRFLQPRYYEARKEDHDESA